MRYKYIWKKMDYSIALVVRNMWKHFIQKGHSLKRESITGSVRVCERQAYAEEAQYYKEKEYQERIARNKEICFEEKEMEGFTFQNVDRDSGAIRIAKEYVANGQKMKQTIWDICSGGQLEQEKVIWSPVLRKCITGTRSYRENDKFQHHIK